MKVGGGAGRTGRMARVRTWVPCLRSIALRQPPNGAVYGLPAAVPVTVDVGAGLCQSQVQVELLADGAVIHRAQPNATTCIYNWPTAVEGFYNLSARAVIPGGGSVTSGVAQAQRQDGRSWGFEYNLTAA